MNNINSGAKDATRALSSFNIGGTGEYRIYDDHGGYSVVSENTYNNYNKAHSETPNKSYSQNSQYKY